MIATGYDEQVKTIAGVNAVMRRDGTVISLDDIKTSAEGQALLDEVDAAILAIEDQLENWLGKSGPPGWEVRAKGALKRKRRTRPALQQRIGELRRAERQSAIPAPRAGPKNEHIENRRIAFINAAEEMLDAELFTEIWARAAETCPAVFTKPGGEHA